MADQIRVYISAAADLERERDILGRSISEIPVQLGWRIHQSPRKNESLDLDAVAEADIYLLIMGGDIRAPIGLEWYRAGRLGREPFYFLKQGILRTPAAQEFLRFVGDQAVWKPFRHVAELRFNALFVIADFILAEAVYYALTPVELETLRSWRNQLNIEVTQAFDERPGGAGESGEIYSTERYQPSSGILLDTKDSSSPA